MKPLRTKISEMLLQTAFKFSDIHIEVGSEMRVRIPKGLVPVDTEKVTHAHLLEFLSGFGANSREAWQKLIDDNGGQYDALFTLESINIRAALFNCGGQMSDGHKRWGLAMRILPRNIPAIGEIGIPAAFRRLYRRENGILFITGITGSGKTTTMAAAINDLNETTQNRIITLEDPLEYIHPSKKSMITQRQMGTDFSDFAGGVKQAMRQDPNVIVIGEVNDIKSLRGAMTAALSGHLVVTSMHTVDAPETVNRVIDLYPSEEKDVIKGMFSQLLIGVVSQKLLPSVKGDRYYLAHEIMMNNNEVKGIIKEGQLQRLQNAIDKQEPLMHLMNGSLARLVEEGKISMEVAEAASTRPETLNDFFGRSYSDD